MTESPLHRRRSTTILGVRRNGQVAIAGDGQITQGDIVLKQGARKIRTMSDGRILVGFAGAIADALTLLAKFEQQLKHWDDNVRRASVELAKEWRSDRYLRRLEAEILVADVDSLLLISGTGDVIEPDDEVLAIGSGSPYAMAAAKALVRSTDLTSREIVERSMTIAGEMCIYTNTDFTVVTIPLEPESADGAERQGPEGQASDDPIDQMAPGPDPTRGRSDEPDDDDDTDDENEERQPVNDPDGQGDEGA